MSNESKSRTKHMPTPWWIDEKGALVVASGWTPDRHDLVVADLCNDSTEDWNNWRHIVACVNACQDTPTEELSGRRFVRTGDAPPMYRLFPINPNGTEDLHSG